ncbi:hypothetical protein [Rhodococcus sp. HNM0569]|uniref:hypothetical protein n=1 Tax=Rhodococcus sp. HNM0569 TaxID=2716340 RepID=UPI00197FE09C|nr:hypothetical protein [Rhodococcus sp. HNM0569]
MSRSRMIAPLEWSSQRPGPRHPVTVVLRIVFAMLVVGPVVVVAMSGAWLLALGLAILVGLLSIPAVTLGANTRCDAISPRVRRVDVDPATGRSHDADTSVPPTLDTVRGLLLPHNGIRVLSLFAPGAGLLVLPALSAARFPDSTVGSALGIAVMTIVAAIPAAVVLAGAALTQARRKYGVVAVADGLLVSNPHYARFVRWEQIAWIRPYHNTEGRAGVEMIRIDLHPSAPPVVRYAFDPFGRLALTMVDPRRDRIELPIQHFDLDPVLLLNLLYDLHTHPELRPELADGRIVDYLRFMLTQPRQ